MTAAKTPMPTTTTTIPDGLQQALVAETATANDISPETLWGIYGADSNFGATSGPTGNSIGPYMFIASADRFHGSFVELVTFFQQAFDAAARYLTSLGANASPDSPETTAALSRYSASGGATYAQSVQSLGASWPQSESSTQ